MRLVFERSGSFGGELKHYNGRGLYNYWSESDLIRTEKGTHSRKIADAGSNDQNKKSVGKGIDVSTNVVDTFNIEKM